ncbi:hypothetical protein C8J56DRAFT_1056434 [Mycena floridula]|nr:hypothetical protein C8J56DRAFT_1056434 [Mycena floridula]
MSYHNGNRFEDLYKTAQRLETAANYGLLLVVNGAPITKYLQERPHFQSVYQQFPWAHIHSGGSANHELTRAQFKVLGCGLDVGFWTWPERSAPHDDEPDGILLVPDHPSNSIPSPRMKSYRHGEIMLAESWPGDTKGWMLEPTLIPRLEFSFQFPPPDQVRDGQVKDWKSWYEWRGLPLASPAANLMDAPLTVYYLLTEILTHLLRTCPFDATCTYHPRLFLSSDALHHPAR